MKAFLISAPYDSGHYKKRFGLGAMVLAEVLESELRKNRHTVDKEEIYIQTSFATEVTTSFAVIRQISDVVREAKRSNKFPIVITGNCNAAAVGTISGLEGKAGIFWFDCHADFNTPDSTLGGFVDGMAVSMVTGECWRTLTQSVIGFAPIEEKNIVLVGGRQFDPQEKIRLDASAIQVISPSDIKQDTKLLLENQMDVASVYLHIDLDVIDPKFVKANEYSIAGGLSPDDLYKSVNLIRDNYNIAAVSFTAYDPSLDPEKKIPDVVSQIVSLLEK
jgi:arginase